MSEYEDDDAVDEIESKEEAAVEQVHQLLIEVKEYLEDNAVTPKGQRLIGKIELTLDNWDDDALFGGVEIDEDDSEDDEDEDLDDEEDEDEDLDDDDEEDEDESILDGMVDVVEIDGGEGE